MDQEVQHLSGGELQRVAITMALGTPADIYLIDEPSAYLDSEQRIIAAKVGLIPWSHTRLDVRETNIPKLDTMSHVPHRRAERLPGLLTRASSPPRRVETSGYLGCEGNPGNALGAASKLQGVQ